MAFKLPPVAASNGSSVYRTPEAADAMLLPDSSSSSKAQKAFEKALPNAQATSTSYLQSWEDIDNEDYDLQDFLPYQRIEKNFAQLIGHTPKFIGYTDDYFTNVLDVGMDQFLVIDADDKQLIGTSHLASCIGVFAKAVTNTGKVKLVVAHASSMTGAKEAFQVIKQALKDCHDFAYYLIGGQLVDPEEDEEDPGTLDEELDFLKQLDVPIQDMRLHVNLSQEESVFAVLTKDKLYYSRKEIFESDPDGKGKSIHAALKE